MKCVNLTERWEYDYAVSQGYEPLIDPNFKLDIKLRKEIQHELFGGFSPQANLKFYKWVWEHKPHICEETMQPLRNYSASVVSHIISKGARPDISLDPRNTNILTLQMHNKWEFGNRKEMRIYNKNQKTIQMLLEEYGQGV